MLQGGGGGGEGGTGLHTRPAVGSAGWCLQRRPRTSTCRVHHSLAVRAVQDLRSAIDGSQARLQLPQLFLAHKIRLVQQQLVSKRNLLHCRREHQERHEGRPSVNKLGDTLRL